MFFVNLNLLKNGYFEPSFLREKYCTCSFLLLTVLNVFPLVFSLDVFLLWKVSYILFPAIMKQNSVVSSVFNTYLINVVCDC